MGPGSSPGRRGENSCFIFPRAGVMRVCVLAARRARAVAIVGPLETQRAQGKPGARCTRGLVCKVHKKMRTRAYRFSGEHPAFPAQWLYGLCRALLGDEFVLSPSPAD